jgi:hypothetical protein
MHHHYHHHLFIAIPHLSVFIVLVCVLWLGIKPSALILFKKQNASCFFMFPSARFFTYCDCFVKKSQIARIAE